MSPSQDVPRKPDPGRRPVSVKPSLDWTRLARAASPEGALELIAERLGRDVQVLRWTLPGQEPCSWRARQHSAATEAVVERCSIPACGTLDVTTRAPLAPGQRQTVIDVLSVWSACRDEVERSRRDAAERSRELDLIQELGRRVADARDPGSLFETVMDRLQREVGVELAVAAHGTDGRGQLQTFLARPFSDACLRSVERRAARVLGWTRAADAGRTEVRIEGFLDGVAPRDTVGEDELVVIPVMAKRQPNACLIVVPDPGAHESVMRVWYAAANHLALHLERIEAVRRAESVRFRSAVDSMPQAVVLTDAELSWSEANASAVELFGAEGVELAGSPEPAFRQLGLMPLVDRVRRESVPVAEGEMSLAGDRTWSVTVSPVDDASRRGALIVVVTDVTESRQLQARLAQAEKMSSLGQMISAVAHELNNPLTSILGYAQLLKATGGGEKLQERLDLVAREADRCKRIVLNLLSFARQRDPDRAPISVNQVVRAVLPLFEYQARADGIRIETRLATGLPSITGDRHQLEQVLVNLINNAAQAMRREGQGSRIVVSTTDGGGAVELDVQDDGPGVPPEYRARIFEPFFTTKPPGQGTGLGLSLVYGITEAHGGRVELVDTGLPGATLRLRLPCPARSAPASRPEGGALPAPHPAASRRILVVDDEDALARLICDVLERDGHVTQRAENGEHALARIGAEPFDLIVTDMRMPRMGAVDLHRRLRKLEPDLARHVLLMTGDTLSEEAEQLAARHGLELLHKPFDVAELVHKVRAVIERSERSGRSGQSSR